MRQRSPSNQRVPDGSPVGLRENRRGNEKTVENRQAERDAFPRPISPGSDCRSHNQQRAADCNGRAHAKKSQARAHTDEFGDERQKISENEIAHGEQSPEFSETIENQLGVTTMRNGAESYCHFLNDEANRECENDERNKKADTKARPGRGIGKH